MTGREMMEWIRENGAEDLEMIYVDDAEIVWDVKPTVERGDEISGEGPDGERLHDEMFYIVL